MCIGLELAAGGRAFRGLTHSRQLVAFMPASTATYIKLGLHKCNDLGVAHARIPINCRDPRPTGHACACSGVGALHAPTGYTKGPNRPTPHSQLFDTSLLPCSTSGPGVWLSKLALTILARWLRWTRGGID